MAFRLAAGSSHCNRLEWFCSSKQAESVSADEELGISDALSKLKLLPQHALQDVPTAQRPNDTVDSQKQSSNS